MAITTAYPHNSFSPPCGTTECRVIHNHLNEALEDILKGDSLFRIMSDNAPVMIWMTDDHGKSIFFNKTWLAFTGRAYKQELGDGWLEGVHPDDHPVLREMFGKCLATQTSCRVEYRLRSADGGYRWVLNDSAPYFISTGQFCGFINTCQDITESKEAKTRLSESEKTLTTIF